MNITEEELQKCAKYKDIDQVYHLDKPRMSYNSIDNKELQKFLDSGYVGTQRMIDRLSKIYGWNLIKSRFNRDDKSIDVILMASTKKFEDHHVSYEDICKSLWWHSFEIVKDKCVQLDKSDSLKHETIEQLDICTYVKPVPFTYEEKEAAMKPLLDATRKHDEEKAEKSGENPEDIEEGDA